mmetsp:Transcript_17295/g.39528  ORF Transcript_17295/g.39528 Transcript_17295/m.39528 type:complete len:249 (-) Transcript_17295:572-1318(-)
MPMHSIVDGCAHRELARRVCHHVLDQSATAAVRTCLVGSATIATTLRAEPIATRVAAWHGTASLPTHGAIPRSGLCGAKFAGPPKCSPNLPAPVAASRPRLIKRRKEVILVGEATVRARRGAGGALLQIVGTPLRRVTKHIVGALDLDKLLLRVVGAIVLVWMMPERKLPVCLLDVFDACTRGEPEHIVVAVLLARGRAASRPTRRPRPRSTVVSAARIAVSAGRPALLVQPLAGLRPHWAGGVMLLR